MLQEKSIYKTLDEMRVSARESLEQQIKEICGMNLEEIAE